MCGTSKVYYTRNLTGPKAHNIIYFNTDEVDFRNIFPENFWKTIPQMKQYGSL